MSARRPSRALAAAAFLAAAGAMLGCAPEPHEVCDLGAAKQSLRPPVDAPADAQVQPMSRASPYTISVQPDAKDASKTALSWTVRVNTGGYRLRTDHVETDASSKPPAARVYLVLEGPRGDEPVGQAFQTLQGSQTIDAKVERAELWIRRTTRGSNAQTTFELAAKSDGAKE